MKNIFFIIITAAALCVSCGNKTDQTQTQLDSVMQVNARMQEQLADYNSFLNVVATSLDSVAVQQGVLITNKDADGKMLSKSQVLNNLEYFSGVLSRQRERMAQLEADLQQKNTAESAKLQNIINYLNEQLETKEAEVQALREQVRQKDAAIANLGQQVSSLKAEQEQTVTQMNEVYVLIGDKARLAELGVLKGTGLIASKKTNISQVDKGVCQQYDRRQLTTLTIEGKEPKLLTPNPAGSYTIEASGAKKWTLTITDADRFWSVSPYLVIQQR